ncbi:MAG: 4Fe-4S dicluster domain-containing protein [Promethearchaeati archaeon SRVP18_Atabeyarchaeia-1]
MALPQYTRTVDPSKVTASLRMLNITLSLNVNREKCTGCGVCVTACPKEAIARGPVGASMKKDVQSPPVLVDERKCSFCGVCDYICPFQAIEFKINGERKLQIVDGKAVPELKYEEVTCERTGNKARKFFKGRIAIHVDKCPGGCSTCADICPTKAITIPKSSKPWEKTEKVSIDDKKCLFCGACINACPGEGALELTRDEVTWSGEHTDFWDETVKKLTTKLTS